MKQLNKIILHIGPDKTGTTAIQRALKTSRALLHEYGVLYSNNLTNNDKWLTVNFCKLTDPTTIFSVKKDEIAEKCCNYINVLKKEIETSSAGVLILSHEGVPHLETDELEALRDFLLHYTSNIEIVVYARAPLSYAGSAISQRIITGRKAWANHLPVLCYKDYLQKMIYVFGKTSILLKHFEKSKFPAGDIVLDFLSILELKESAKLQIVENANFKGNPALSSQAIQVGERLIEVVGKTVPEGGAFRFSFANELRAIKGKKIKLTKKQKELIQEHASEHSIYLEKEFGLYFSELTNESVNDDVELLSPSEIEQKVRDIIFAVMPDQKWLLFKSQVSYLYRLCFK